MNCSFWSWALTRTWRVKLPALLPLPAIETWQLPEAPMAIACNAVKAPAAEPVAEPSTLPLGSLMVSIARKLLSGVTIAARVWPASRRTVKLVAEPGRMVWLTEPLKIRLPAGPLSLRIGTVGGGGGGGGFVLLIAVFRSLEGNRKSSMALWKPGILANSGLRLSRLLFVPAATRYLPAPTYLSMLIEV